VLEDLNGRVDIVLDGGITPIGLESTVLDLSQDPPCVLRPGGVLLEQIQTIAPATRLATKYLNEDDSEMASPGMLVKHYSPRAELQVFQGTVEKVIETMQNCCREYAEGGKIVGVMVPEEQRQHFLGLPCQLVSLGSAFDFEAIARNLFAALRHLDQRGVDVILTPGVAQQGLGVAIWDRLIRAAEGKIIQVD
jgi:L-threonylcarbamoyladenylate synthase